MVLEQESGLCLVLLSPQQDAFHRLADSAARLQRQLAESSVPQVPLLIYMLPKSNQTSSWLAMGAL